MKKVILAASAAALAISGLAMPSFAQAPQPAALTGSNFEIENDANLVLDTAAPNLDWDTVTEVRQQDKPTGSGDDSFGNGTKEDSAVPSVIDGSIPPNKSDLKYFGGYQEGNTTNGFLNLYWTRVQDPSGTTNMDFELNKSSTLSSNGVTPIRSPGDLLITYDLSNGGTKATISKRTWSGSSWGAATAFGDGDAIGTINTSPISAANGAGLGSLSARTFGEASIRLAPLFGNPQGCVTFGKAYLKSRSSDAFNSAVKDFIAPVDINITNCGTVNITKTDDANPAQPLQGAVFTLYNDAPPLGGVRSAADTITTKTCTTSAAGTCSITDVPFGPYWVVETTTPAGYATADDQAVAINGGNPTASVSFVDVRLRGAVKVLKEYSDAAAPDGSTSLAGAGFTLYDADDNIVATGTTAGSDGSICFGGLPFGDYRLSETTVPANFDGADDQDVTVNNAATCADNPYVGEAKTFTNTPLSKIVVGFKAQVAGATTADIECKKGSTVLNGDEPTVTAGSDTYPTRERNEDLAPGTYVCTVVISD